MFDWIYEQKFANQDKAQQIFELLEFSVQQGNAHCFIQLLSEEFDLFEKYSQLTDSTSKEGFYILAKMEVEIFEMLLNNRFEFAKRIKRKYYGTHIRRKFSKGDSAPWMLLSRRPLLNSKYKYQSVRPSMNKHSSFIKFGNYSIFKLQERINKKKNDFIQNFSFAVENKDIKIIESILENIQKEDKSLITSEYIFEMLSNSIINDTSDIFFYLFNKFKLINPSFISNENKLFDLLNSACKRSNIKVVKKLTKKILQINSNENFTKPFLIAANSPSIQICQFFIDKKVYIEYQNLSTQNIPYNTNKETLILIINNSPSEMKTMIQTCFLHPAISNKNIQLVDYLLYQNVPIENALIDAVNTNDLEIVNIVLQHNKKASFINKRTKEGSALSIAIKNNNLQIVQRLLSLQGINPNLYNEKGEPPLIQAVLLLNVEIVDAFIDFHNRKQKK